MSKEKTKQNKTAAIVEEYAKNPSAKPAEIAEILNKRGIDVTPAYVSTIKSIRKRNGEPIGAATAAAPFKKRGSGADISLEELKVAKSLADQLGGIDHATKVLEALRKLT